MMSNLQFQATIFIVNKSWQYLEFVKRFGIVVFYVYLCAKMKKETYIITNTVKTVAKAIIESKMSFYHWVICRDLTDAKDWKARSVIRGLVPYRYCKFNELSEDDLGSLMIICKRKDLKTETHLLSDDEVDELAVLLGINLYSSEDGRIFRTDMMRTMIDQFISQKISPSKSQQ